ncbi:PEP/pyruvate-binding domain-containing protein [Streptacidiphilus sp. EB129]|uniref:PEP/pyruvate-binding domain-containing protein n=1 Tax=Streptacidiphilus sp. EB129 TaxID=3156262 RepID=UPI00351202FE
MTDLVDLSAAHDASRFGNKAANLARLIGAGIPVPPGLVVPVAGAVSPDAVERIVLWAREHAPWGLVVRSSAQREDSGGASYAGMFESLFCPVDAEALERAIRAVQESGDSERVRLYEQALGLRGQLSGLAVLIQAAIRPHASGVCFSQWPTGTDGFRIESALGLSTLLLQGEVLPDVVEGSADDRRDTTRSTAEKYVIPLPALPVELDLLPGEWIEGHSRHLGSWRAKLAYSDPDEGIVYLRPPQGWEKLPALPSDAEDALLPLGGRLTELYGNPALDIEWVYDGDGRIWIVQVRPATAAASAGVGGAAPTQAGSGQPGELVGRSAAPGLVDGVTEVVEDPARSAEFTPGRILVSGPARPELMPAIVACTGIVSADAGLLCHTAIVARELGKPCVVGVHEALELLPTGTPVRLDGSGGTVRPLTAGEPAARAAEAARFDVDPSRSVVEVLAGVAALTDPPVPRPGTVAQVLIMDRDLLAAAEQDAGPLLAAGTTLSGFLLPPEPPGAGRSAAPAAIAAACSRLPLGSLGDVLWTQPPPPPPYDVVVYDTDDRALFHRHIPAARSDS